MFPLPSVCPPPGLFAIAQELKNVSHTTRIAEHFSPNHPLGTRLSDASPLCGRSKWR